MSMNFYIQSGAEDELMQLAAADSMLTTISMQSRRGKSGAPAAAVKEALKSLDLSEASFEKKFKEYEESVKRQGFFARLLHRFVRKDIEASWKEQQRAMAAEIEGLDDADVFGDDAPEALDLHKSWHMLHYLFTGTAWEGSAPANTLLVGGRDVGEDLGYGPARIIDPKATRAFAAFLEPLDIDDLRPRLNLRKMAALDIYCAGDPEDEGDLIELEEDLGNYFPMLREYVLAAASRREALAVWMA